MAAAEVNALRCSWLNSSGNPLKRGMGPSGVFHDGLRCLPTQSPKMEKSVGSSSCAVTMISKFGERPFSSNSPYFGVYPVSAHANADRPDSRLVVNSQYELPKAIAFDSAHAAMPAVTTPSHSYGVQDWVGRTPNWAYRSTISWLCCKKSGATIRISSNWASSHPAELSVVGTATCAKGSSASLLKNWRNPSPPVKGETPARWAVWMGSSSVAAAAAAMSSSSRIAICFAMPRLPSSIACWSSFRGIVFIIILVKRSRAFGKSPTSGLGRLDKFS